MVLGSFGGHGATLPFERVAETHDLTLIVTDCDGAVETHVIRASSTSSDVPFAATPGGAGVASVQTGGCATATGTRAAGIANAKANKDSFAMEFLQ